MVAIMAPDGPHDGARLDAPARLDDANGGQVAGPWEGPLSCLQVTAPRESHARPRPPTPSGCCWSMTTG